MELGLNQEAMADHAQIDRSYAASRTLRATRRCSGVRWQNFRDREVVLVTFEFHLKYRLAKARPEPDFR